MEKQHTTFRLSPTIYEVGDWIGEGAFGVVRAAVHKPSGTKVAIKKVTRFDDRLSCLRALREITLSRHLQHENIISILDIPQLPLQEGFRELYLVMELMPIDLRRVIQSQELTNPHCQYFVYQLLRGLKYIHSAGILHRDLKPENVLLNSDCDLKICDFGLARASTDQTSEMNFMTEYVATRWYRAPEIMLKFKTYNTAIDLWSTGCILFEMISRKILFPGSHYHDQIVRILHVMGFPSEDEFNAIRSRRAKEYLLSLPKRRKQPWRSLLPCATDDALDLIDRLLTFNPDRRITAEEALKHSFVALYHDPNDEPRSELVGQEVLFFDRTPELMSKETLKRQSYLYIEGEAGDSDHTQC